MTPETYRVIGCNGRREKIVASGLSHEDAKAMKERMNSSPLCWSYKVSIERENPLADARIEHMRTLHAR